MKLLLDVGNSRVKWVFDKAGIVVAHGDALRDDEVGLRPLMESDLLPDQIRIANVAGAEAGARIAASVREHFRIAPIFAGSPTTGAGVRSGYTVAGQLGVDRWLGICAAYGRYRAPVCVVDAGTATTIDFVTGSGQHQGGLILPGIGLMQSALLRETGDLARLSAATGGALPGDLPASTEPNHFAHPIALGRDTDAAIRCGALLATVSTVRACMDGFIASSPVEAIPPRLLVTGGAGPALVTGLRRAGEPSGSGPLPGYSIEYRPQLVLEGLALDPPCFVVVG